MANATQTTLGDIQLAGDLAGNNNALAPELTSTTVTPGSYVLPHITVDAKGRITSATSGASADITALIPHASSTVYGTVKIGDNIRFDSSQGYVVIDYNGVLTNSSQTNLCVIADSISVIVTQVLNGVTTSRTVKISGEYANGTIADFITWFNYGLTVKGLSVTLALSGGNLVLSVAAGAGNTVTISYDNIFPNITGYVATLTNVEGTGDGTIWVPIATASSLGVVKAGSGFNVNGSGVISFDTSSLPKATTSSLGVVQIGSNIDVDGNGVISTALPTATTSVLGLVKPDGVTIGVTDGVISGIDATSSTKGVLKVDGTSITASSGVISVDTQALTKGTSSVYGVMKVDGTTLTASSGVVSVNTGGLPTATTSNLGVVKVDGTTITSAAGVISSVIPVATSSTLGMVKIDSGAFNNTNGLISVKTATSSSRGVIQPDNLTITVSAGTLSVPIATSLTKGIVKVDGTSITSVGGVISAVLPTATSSTLGLVKPDNSTIVVDGAGVLSIPEATASTLGIVKTDNTTIINTAGTLSIPTATNSVLGIVRPDGTSMTISGGILSVNTASFPQATTSSLGVVKIGSGLSVISGVISATAIANATTTSYGVVKIGSGISVTSGVISLTPATTSALGGVKVDGTTLTASSGTISVNSTAVGTLGARNTWTKAQVVQLATLTDAATISCDLSVSNIFKVTLAGNRTLGTPTNPIVGGRYTICFIQDATGSRTMTWPGSFKFRSGQSTTLSTAANTTDVLTLTYVSSGVYLADLVKGF